MASIDTPFIELLSADPRYRKLINSAIRSNDQHALQALKGKLNQPIHFVTNWFMYYLMIDEQDLSDIVVIWSPQVRADYAGFSINLAKEGTYIDDDDNGADSGEIEVIPLDTYSFLK